MCVVWALFANLINENLFLQWQIQKFHTKCEAKSYLTGPWVYSIGIFYIKIICPISRSSSFTTHNLPQLVDDMCECNWWTITFTWIHNFFFPPFTIAHLDWGKSCCTKVVIRILSPRNGTILPFDFVMYVFWPWISLHAWMQSRD